MMTSSPLPDAALEYAASGILIFPCWGVRDERCLCRAVRCENPGKHPLGTLIPHGHKDASVDPARVRAWWSHEPSANIGMPTHARLVLDVDPRHGGDETLRRLEQQYGPLPETPEVLTGGGGRHLHFAQPTPPLRNSVGVLGAGLDVRGVGGYVLLPPSRHVSGGVYWTEAMRPIFETPLAPLPPWLVRLLLTTPRGTKWPAAGATIPEGQRNETLYRLGRALVAKGLSPDAVRAALVAENAARCRPLLPPAEIEALARHAVTQPDRPAFQHRGDGPPDISGKVGSRAGRGPFPKRRPPRHVITVVVG